MSYRKITLAAGLLSAALLTSPSVLGYEYPQEPAAPEDVRCRSELGGLLQLHRRRLGQDGPHGIGEREIPITGNAQVGLQLCLREMLKAAVVRFGAFLLLESLRKEFLQEAHIRSPSAHAVGTHAGRRLNET